MSEQPTFQICWQYKSNPVIQGRSPYAMIEARAEGVAKGFNRDMPELLWWTEPNDGTAYQVDKSDSPESKTWNTLV